MSEPDVNQERPVQDEYNTEWLMSEKVFDRRKRMVGLLSGLEDGDVDEAVEYLRDYPDEASELLMGLWKKFDVHEKEAGVGKAYVGPLTRWVFMVEKAIKNRGQNVTGGGMSWNQVEGLIQEGKYDEVAEHLLSNQELMSETFIKMFERHKPLGTDSSPRFNLDGLKEIGKVSGELVRKAGLEEIEESRVAVGVE